MYKVLFGEKAFGFVEWLLTVEESEIRQADSEMQNDMFLFWNALSWYILKA